MAGAGGADIVDGPTREEAPRASRRQSVTPATELSTSRRHPFGFVYGPWLALMRGPISVKAKTICAFPRVFSSGILGESAGFRTTGPHGRAKEATATGTSPARGSAVGRYRTPEADTHTIRERSAAHLGEERQVPRQQPSSLMATMDRDLDALDRALQAVKTRSANALVNEQSYISRIAQLEEVNRQLQAQLTVQTGLPTNAPANASEGSADPDGMKRSSSYMSMRTKSNHLVVAQLASDDRHGSDDSAGGAGEEHRAASAVAADRHSNDRSPPMPTIPTSHLRDDGTSATSSISSADSPSKVTFSRAPGLGV